MLDHKKSPKTEEVTPKKTTYVPICPRRPARELSDYEYKHFYDRDSNGNWEIPDIY